jgi:hypothetical protein
VLELEKDGEICAYRCISRHGKRRGHENGRTENEKAEQESSSEMKIFHVAQVSTCWQLFEWRLNIDRVAKHDVLRLLAVGQRCVLRSFENRSLAI